MITMTGWNGYVASSHERETGAQAATATGPRPANTLPEPGEPRICDQRGVFRASSDT
ncbi:hypothetical protein [Accumulibacter sp.]|uniref:hypothetical protein n=1 Tax=Accumulibacter sp. TaxID=2053492 RepID=UPI0025DC16DB|nr:hypothetical protein [Accumulibacter sp.]MCM8625763.1 hypothetical protein [Accumulibacter sp.]